MGWKDAFQMVGLASALVLLVVFGGGAAIHYGQRFFNPEMTGCWDTCEAAGFDHGRYDGQECLCFGPGTKVSQ